jgi:hypothetical protein
VGVGWYVGGCLINWCWDYGLGLVGRGVGVVKIGLQVEKTLFYITLQHSTLHYIYNILHYIVLRVGGDSFWGGWG